MWHGVCVALSREDERVSPPETLYIVYIVFFILFFGDGAGLVQMFDLLLAMHTTSEPRFSSIKMGDSDLSARISKQGLECCPS